MIPWALGIVWSKADGNREDDGGARTHGTGFRPGSMVRIFLAPQTQPEQPEQPELAAAGMAGSSIGPMMELGHISVEDLGAFTGTVALPGDLAPDDYVLQVTGVTVANSGRAVTLGVRALDTDATITAFKGERTRVSGRLDRVVVTGISDGVPAGTFRWTCATALAHPRCVDSGGLVRETRNVNGFSGLATARCRMTDV